ncbi:hypothetical protein G9A89_012399 [Geosiphon pyriformis]|nr:hypothetical protein G9A89_012399 [Geosiphon pyriformis]
MIDFLFVFLNLVNAVVDHNVCSIGEFFDTDYWIVSMSVDLGELLNVWLNSLCKQLLDVIFDLPNGKAAGLLGITNELWKHCNKSILDMLLTWILMILKPYEWEGVFTNTHPIALIKTAYKILSKILFDRISLVCSTFSIFRGDNFLVLKGMMIQSLIFAVGSVVEDALKKNRKLWLVFLVRIKMCGKFIQFFSSIYRDCTNRVITNFGLMDGYRVHNGLDQGKVFSPFLWHIFYDPLLCKVKRQESMCVSCSQTTTQHILNVASEFFRINNISINNDKTVAIPINSRVSILSLSISGSPISIAKKGFSKPNLVKTNLDIHFFTNLVLKKAVSDKQFLYLVSAVLHPIVSYRMQFSFVPIGMCGKWDVLICKDLKFKSSLLLDFFSDIIHHPFFYGLKSFVQIQSESKMVFFISFANSDSILGCLFSHRSHNLQVLCWHSVYPLSSPVHIYVSASNNFFADMIHIFFDCNLSLGGSLANLFQFCGGILMSVVLGKLQFLRFLPSLQ